MTIFGSFTFSRIVKTFLPGIPLFLAILLPIDLLLLPIDEAHSGNRLLMWITAQNALFITLFIPGCLICGLILNMIIYGGFHEKLIKRQAYKKDPDLFVLYENISKHIMEKCITRRIESRDESLKDGKRLDPLYFILPEIDLQKYYFLQESYQYYVDFGVNMAGSLIISSISFNLWWLFKDPFEYSVVYALFPFLGATVGKCIFILATLSTTCIVSYLLVKSSIKNYLRHYQNTISLYYGVICLEKEFLDVQHGA